MEYDFFSMHIAELNVKMKIKPVVMVSNSTNINKI